ncbi:hypothetical protein ES703_98683 [subsurface metagenome]
MAHLLPILIGIAHVMEIVTFIQFIHEEAIQSANLGVFMAVRSKCFPAAIRGLGLLRMTLIPHLKNVNDFAGYLAPYSKLCFEDFVKASEANLDIMEEALFAYKG